MSDSQSRKPHMMRKSGAENVLVLYWGRLCGGASYTLEVTRALQTERKGKVFGSFAIQNELHERMESLDIPTLWISTYSSKLSFILSSILVPLKLGRLLVFIKRNGITTIYCTMTHYWMPFVIVAAKVLEIRLILTCHDALPHPGEAGAVRAVIMKWEMRHAHSIVVLSRHVEGKIREFTGPTKAIHVVPLGLLLHLDVDEPMAPASHILPRRLLFFGRILDYKGLGLLLGAYRIMKEGAYPYLTLEIAGNGELSPYRESLVDLADVVFNNRWISEEEIPAIFRRNDILVVPYIEASQSGPVATALAFGIPSVVTPVGGLTEQIIDGKTGVIASAVSVDGIAQAISHLISSPDLYRECATRAKAYAKEHLAWSVIGVQINAIINQDSHGEF